MKFILIILTVLTLAAVELQACTTFCLKDGEQVIYGANYDWDIGNGLLMINKRNVKKTATLQKDEEPAKWISKYGSVTFNQYGREFPTGGINEAGLVVQLMMLQESQYPAHDQLPTVDCLEWIQYQLDNSGTVADVLEKSRRIRISSSVKLHYLVCDHSGACVTAEFLNGLFAPHYGATLPIAVLTNDTYENSLQYLRTLVAFGGTAMPSFAQGSLDRLGRAATMMKNYPFGQGANIVNYGFDILNNVASGDYTKWSIVYDLPKARVYFQSWLSKERKQLDLKNLDFTCTTPVKVLNVNAMAPGDVLKRLRKYTTAINRQLVRESFHNTPFLTNIPDSQLESIIKHPERFVCLQN